jgi:hypothetical protein
MAQSWMSDLQSVVLTAVVLSTSFSSVPSTAYQYVLRVPLKPLTGSWLLSILSFFEQQRISKTQETTPQQYKP